MTYELELFGFYLTNHPVVEFKRKNTYIDLKDIANYFDKNIETVVLVDKVREIETKNKKKMAFITASDELSKVEIVLFPKVFENLNGVIAGKVVRIKGKVEKRFNEYQIIANQIINLN